MHTSQVLESNRPVEFGKHGIERFRGTQVVTAGKEVAGVEADADSRFVLDTVDDACEMFEPAAEVAALPGGVFDDRGDATCGIEREAHRFRDKPEAFILTDQIQVASRMKIQHDESEHFSTLHLGDEGGAGLVQLFRIGIAEVDEVTVVRKDVLRQDSDLPAVASESLCRLLGEFG